MLSYMNCFYVNVNEMNLKCLYSVKKGKKGEDRKVGSD